LARGFEERVQPEQALIRRGGHGTGGGVLAGSRVRLRPEPPRERARGRGPDGGVSAADGTNLLFARDGTAVSRELRPRAWGLGRIDGDEQTPERERRKARQHGYSSGGKGAACRGEVRRCRAAVGIATGRAAVIGNWALYYVSRKDAKSAK